MAGRGAVCLQLLQVLGAIIPLPVWGRTSHHPKQVGGHTGGPPLHVPIWDHTYPPSGGTSRSGAILAGTIYAGDAAFDGIADSSSRLMTLLLKRGGARGYFPEPAKLLLICNFQTMEETAKQSFELEGLRFNVVLEIQYLGAYIGPAEERDAWVRPQVYK